MNQDRMDRYFMDIARLTAKLSYAVKKKVGCVVTSDNRIISIGFNGQPPGFDNVCEYVGDDGKLKTYDSVIHAEANAIYWCAKAGTSVKGATVYVTLSPCKHCALTLIQAGVVRVVYEEEYWNRDKTGLDLLMKAGIRVQRLATGEDIPERI